MRRPGTKLVAGGILVVALLLAGVVSLYASTSPDGLTKVSQDKDFARTATPHATDDSPFAGYGTSFLGNDRAGKGVAGVVGVLVVLGLAGGTTLLLRRRTTATSVTTSPETTSGSPTTPRA